MKRSKALGKIAAAVFWLGVWAVAAKKVGQELILPGPVTVLQTLFVLCKESDFWFSALYTLFRIFGGFAVGVILGTVLAVLTSVSTTLGALLSPVIKIIRAVPVASFIILAMLWIGRAIVPCFVSALIVIPVVWGAVSSAIAEADGNLLEMGRVYKIGRWKTLRYIYAPSVFPSWRAAVVTALGLAWKSGVAAEVICLPRLSVGAELYYSKIYLETPSLFAWTAIVLILSFMLEAILKRATERRVQND